MSQSSHVERSNVQGRLQGCMTAGIQDACRGELLITFACRCKDWLATLATPCNVDGRSRIWVVSVFHSIATARCAALVLSWTLAPGVIDLYMHNNSSCAGLRPASECDDNIVPYV